MRCYAVVWIAEWMNAGIWTDVNCVKNVIDGIDDDLIPGYEWRESVFAVILAEFGLEGKC